MGGGKRCGKEEGKLKWFGIDSIYPTVGVLTVCGSWYETTSLLSGRCIISLKLPKCIDSGSKFPKTFCKWVGHFFYWSKHPKRLARLS